MFRIAGLIRIKDKWSVFLEGDVRKLYNGIKTVDENNNIFTITNIGSTHFHNPEDILRYANVIIEGDVNNIGKVLFIKDL